jgi:hypothetical protein
MNRAIAAIGAVVVALACLFAVRHVAAGAAGRFALEKFVVSAVATLAYAFVLGRLTRLAVGNRGFSPMMNGLIAAAGSWLTLVAVGGRGAATAIGLTMGVAMVGSVVALAAAIVAKARFGGGLNTILDRHMTAKDVVAARVDKISMPRGPSQERLRAAVSRANR